MNITVIIPAHNEEKRISQTLEDFNRTIIKKYGKGITLLVVSDGSVDMTNAIVRKYAKRYGHIKLLTAEKKAGKGGAVIRGFKYALGRKNDIIGFVDADPSVSGAEVVKMINTLNGTGVDGVIASRYLKDSRVIGKISASRHYASRGYNMLVRLLFGLSYQDTQCGAKFFRAQSLRKVIRNIYVSDLSFDVNLLYELKRSKLHVLEIPITYKVISEGTKVTVNKQMPKMFASTAGYRISSIFGRRK